MSQDEIHRITKKNKGELLEFSDDIFEKTRIRCLNNHEFSLYNNDLLLGKWCDMCNKSISIVEDILKKLNIVYEKNHILDQKKFDYVISGARKFLIFMSSTSNDEEMEIISRKHSFNCIIIFDEKHPTLKEDIWEAIKNNTPISKLGQTKKNEECHNCTEEIFLSKEKDDTGSIIKNHPGPYPENIHHAFGYIRVSTVMQVQDGFSLETQESKIYAECRKNNLFLKSIYIDKGISGGSLEKRLSLEKLRTELKENQWIIVTSVSRLARNTKDLLSLAEEIENKKCHLIIIDLNMDITSPSGKLVLTLMASQAQFERELTSERVKGVLQHLKNAGNLRSKPRFGWKMNPDRTPGAAIHIRNEEEQEIIKRLRSLRQRNTDLKITSFTAKLNKTTIPPPRKSQKWYHKTVRVIMEKEGIK